MEAFGENVLGIIQLIGIVGSVIILIVAGIKYMTGSIEEKADYKKALLPYVVGAILLFSATTIANVLYQYADSIARPDSPAPVPGGNPNEERTLN